MNRDKYSLSILVLTTLLLTGCASFGPTIYIDTEKKVDDFIVTCSWGALTAPLFHGSRKVGKTAHYVVSSKEDFSCGLGIGVGSSLNISHPLYATTGVCQREGCGAKQTKSGAYIVRPTEKLTQLDECEQKYKAGYWAKNKWPNSRYAECMGRVCGFPRNYFNNYYDAEGGIDKAHLKNIYNQEILRCLERVYPVLIKYSSHSYRGVRPTAKQQMNSIWNSKKWNEYK